MGYTLGTGSKATGVSRTAILRAIKAGKISAAKNHHGEYDIDPAELHRVYPPLGAKSVTDNVNATPQVNDTQHHDNRGLQAEILVLRERLAEKDEIIGDLREDRDQWRTQAQSLRLLTDQRSDPKPYAEALDQMAKQLEELQRQIAEPKEPLPEPVKPVQRRKWWQFGKQA